MATDRGHAAKRIKLDFSEEVTVLVGPEEKRYVVHKAIISNHSKFFKAACAANFKEGREKIIRLPEVDIEAFRSYAQWAYSGEVVVASDEEISADAFGVVRGTRLAKLYVLAEFLGDTFLRNTVVDQLRTLHTSCETGPGTAEIIIAFEDVPAESTLRRLVLGWYLDKACVDVVEWMDENCEELPKAFFVDLAIKQFQASLNGIKASKWDQGKCTYHEHNDEVPACV
ncbi:hypothetical protein LTR36_006963 [Oleoguttula mirabilis]|uniref:BTB domain-containing protein n=1 Tax=Oleoguttula mirabilis TaxID=1507867 RepID=A0AAV9JAY6_9PEZI|nr:hypothetical protein LTR36_006963 [Oleoguttula mirabilis]